MSNIKAIILPLLMMAVAAVAASCSKDEEGTLSDGQHIAGSYAGKLTWNVMGIEETYTDAYEVKVIAGEADPNTVSVVLPECKFTVPGTDREVTIPSMVANSATVTESGNVYTFTQTEFSLTAGPMTLSGSNLRGKVAGKDAEVVYTITPGTMPMPINFTFKGTLK